MLDELTLAEIKPVYPWTKLPLGSLIRVQVEDAIETCMRCRWDFAHQSIETLLILGGNRVGMLAAQNVSGACALDVSELVEITAIKSEASLYLDNAPGVLCHDDGGFYVWFNSLERPGSGWICISSPKSELVGTEVRTMSQNRIRVSQSISVRLKQQLNGR